MLISLNSKKTGRRLWNTVRGGTCVCVVYVCVSKVYLYLFVCVLCVFFYIVCDPHQNAIILCDRMSQ